MPYFNRASTCKRRYRHYSGRSISTDRKSPIFESTRIDQVDYHANIIERELLYKNHDSNEHEHVNDYKSLNKNKKVNIVIFLEKKDNID
ncbi:unnamed protein product [Rotaria socialis]|uniref:Uncharacterized protein n=1 Tax=Rotaria socialis TaxID=392032 RepID=A0A818FG07_9BILA|nr:unnamed protein product [Rotaria socialis]CAF4958582.1 unnamed protein product [Rotaria socialis]